MFRFFVTCAQGLGSFVLDELKALGIEGQISATGVIFEGEIEDAYQVCLWSRCASKVLLELKAGNTNDLDKIYKDLEVFQWSLHFEANQTFAITATTRRAKHINTLYATQKVKDAIVDYFKEHFDMRPDVDKDNPDIQFQLHIDENSYALYLDLSGESLHKRGFRAQAGIAPIKETLAAALLYKSKWPEQAKENKDFLDPMCGAGTILIEAALMAQDIAPGIFRTNYGFSKWKQHKPAIWDKCRSEAKARALVGRQAYTGRLYGVDRNPKMITIARANAERADVIGKIILEKADFIQFKPGEDNDLQKDNCLIVTNPPYGERLGSGEELSRLYATLGVWLKNNFEHINAGIIITDTSLGKVMGLRAKKVNKFFNGPLECQYLQFEVSEEFHVDREKADLRRQENIIRNALSEGGEDFKNRLSKNRVKWDKWAKKHNIEAYRVYDADLPEFNVAIDFYQEAIVLQEYAPPKTIDAEKAAKRLEKILTIIPMVYPEIPSDKIYFKKRERQKGQAQYERLNTEDAYFQVKEGSALFWVNLSDYLDTGLFLDHRNIRLMIHKMAKNKRFLNLFAYTGTASVHAAIGGADSTMTIDMSKTYLNWAQQNFELNNIYLRENHDFVQANVLEWLATECEELEKIEPARQSDYKFDLIFMDPPSFSNSKRMEGVLDIQRDHSALIDQAMSLLDEGGTLIFSSNLRKFKMDAEVFEKYQIKDISKQSLPEDFERNSKIRQCFLIEAKCEELTL